MNNKKIEVGLFLFSLSCCASLIVAIGLLGNSRDYLNYVDQYNQARLDVLLTTNGGSDFLFSLLMSLFNSIGFEFIVFNFAIVFFCIISKLYLFNHVCKRAFFVTILLYFSQLFWLHEYTQFRLSLALTICLIAIYGDRNRLFLFLLAPLIHFSVVIIPALYYFINRFSLKIILSSLFCMLLFFLFAANSFTDYLLSLSDTSTFPFLYKLTDYAYFMRTDGLAELNILSPTPALQFFVIMASARRSLNFNPSLKMELFFSIFGILCFYSFSPIPIVATRFYEMFIVFFIIYIARSWKALGWVKLFIAPYLFLSLRASFFSSEPIIQLFNI